jgi:hypothetical protein
MTTAVTHAKVWARDCLRYMLLPIDIWLTLLMLNHDESWDPRHHAEMLVEVGIKE